MKKSLLFLPLLMVLAACAPIQNQARDGIAAAKGVLQTAQAKFKDQCAFSPAANPCVVIHKGVAAQNVAIDALEVYCEGGTTPSFKNGGPCSPQKANEAQLRAALDGLNRSISDIKGLL